MKKLMNNMKRIICLILTMVIFMTGVLPITVEAAPKSYKYKLYLTQYYSGSHKKAGTATMVWTDRSSGYITFDGEGFKLGTNDTYTNQWQQSSKYDLEISSSKIYFSRNGQYIYIHKSESLANKTHAVVRAKLHAGSKTTDAYRFWDSADEIKLIDSFKAKNGWADPGPDKDWGEIKLDPRVYFRVEGWEDSEGNYTKVTVVDTKTSANYMSYSLDEDNAFADNAYYNGGYSSASSYVKNYEPGKYRVQTSSLNIRSGPSTNYGKVSSALPYGTEISITKISNGWGYGSVNGIYGWVSLYYCSYVGPNVTVPNAPTVKLDTSTKIPVTGLMTVSWDSVYDAQYYTCTFYDASGNAVKSYNNIYGNSCSFTPETAGTYTAKVVAHNSLYSSQPGSLNQSVTAYATSTVVYKNDDGSVIASQQVPYGQNATAPIAPEKEGYTFKEWQGSLTNVTEDREIIAKYTINEYTVQFIDYKGEIVSVQSVKYGEDATPPEVDDVPEKNKVFTGWSSTDYQDVYTLYKNEPIKIYAVYGAENEDLPIVSTITQAYRQPDGYYVYFSLENTVDEITRGRAIVALKTSTGKLIDMTESAAFSIPANGTKENMEVFLPCDTAATVVELIIVDSYASGVPIATNKTSTIEKGRMWSEWYDEDKWAEVQAPLGDDVEIETRTEYRYRTKDITTGNTKTKEGYTYIEGSQVASVGSWSAWQDTTISAFSYEDRMREVQTQNVDVYTTSWYYVYYHFYKSGGGNHTYCPTNHYGGTYHCYGTYSPFTWYKYSTCGSRDLYTGERCVSGADTSYGYWFYNSSDSGNQSYVSGTKTQYRYRDTTYTYSFYRWNDWSEWSTTAITANDTRDVETRTVYRYQSTSALKEDTSGTVVPFSGKVDASLAGRNITLFISKHNASSDFTNEYVGQTTIESDGSYSFNYVLREEPTAETGDFVISIGVEGMTDTMQVGVIPAPTPVYTVKFLDANGSVISEQTVEKGKNAVVPETAPEKEGYTFVSWNNSCTNIQSDLEISPIYTENKYTVVYIDFRTDSYEVMTYKYGEPLIAPSFEDCDSGYAKGWDAVIDGTTVVTSDMVITATYETKTYEVAFYDKDGNVVDVQTIDYDGVAKMPELPEEDGVIYYDWNITEEDLMNIKEPLAILPLYEFEETTENPVASVTSGAYASQQTVELSCETEDAIIFYTLDGTDPSDNPDAIMYEEPITIDATSTLTYYATSINRNDSELCEELYVINGEGHLVTVNSTLEDGFTYEFIINSMSDIVLDDFNDEIGYTAEGFYYDAECIQKANLNNDEFSELVTLYVNYSINAYNVTFLDTDGTVLSKETIEFGGSATPPEMSDRGTLIFLGWSGGDYECVIEDMEVIAIYKEESEIVKLTLNRNTYTMDEGDAFQINATIEPVDKTDLVLVWISTDESVATVDETGFVTAVGSGTATIYAVTEDDSAIAACEITVDASPNYSICLKDLSTLNFDDLGYLRRIPLADNTVTFVSSQLKNNLTNITFTNFAGEEISGDSLVGTGTVITLKNGEEILDEKIAVMTGDVTGDGKINNRDVAYVARLLVNKQTAEEYQLLSMDVNGDGKVNNRDVAMVSRYLVGKNELSA